MSGAGAALGALPPSYSSNPGVLDLQGLNLTSEQLEERLAALSDDDCLQVKRLYLQNNDLTRLPSLISRFSRLDILYVSGNRLESLPEELFSLCHLRTLYVPINHLSSLSASICKLSNLENLSLHNNSLHVLPTTLSCLTQLKVLYLKHNPLPSTLACNVFGDAQSLVARVVLYFTRHDHCRDSIQHMLALRRRKKSSSSLPNLIQHQHHHHQHQQWLYNVPLDVVQMMGKMMWATRDEDIWLKNNHDNDDDVNDDDDVKKRKVDVMDDVLE